MVLAPDSFSGTLTARAAAEAMATGWRRRSPLDVLDLCPLSDGGPGFVDVLQEAVPGVLHAVTATGPLGAPAPAELLLGDEDGVRVAYAESAQACGAHLVPEDRRDPWAADSAGVAALLLEARAAGAERIVLGLGGAASADGGRGLLGALARAEGLRDDDDLGFLPALRRAWAPVQLVIATDVDAPLLGPQGAVLGAATGRGADTARALEERLTTFAGTALAAADLPRKLLVEAGAGAAGGLGFGLLLLGARRVIGAQTVIDAVGLARRMRAADLVVTGEGCFDWQSLRGKVVTGVARTALDTGTPAVVVAGQVLVGRRESVAIGIEATYPVARDLEELPGVLADPVGTLAARTERVARTWSRA